MYKKLSVLIPVFNEKKTIKKCVDNILNADTFGMELEIIISDNNSNDGTVEELKLINHNQIKIFFKDKNTGKGANLKNALAHATGDLILFQDADLEYSPDDYPSMLKPFFELNADVVYGSRFIRSKFTRIVGFPNYIANKIFTLLANILYNMIFTDIATGYKVFRSEVIKSLQIQSNGFEIEPEITAKISKIKKINIYEVPISINSRDYDDGKKVRWWHFFIYIYTLLKWRFKK